MKGTFFNLGVDGENRIIIFILTNDREGQMVSDPKGGGGGKTEF